MDAMEVFAILNKKIKMNGISEEEIKKSVAEYLAENGITSPVANVTKTENGAIIYIKDASGPTQVEIKNGDPGYTPQKGIDYFDGAQGPVGPIGPEGPKGEKGDVGEQGPIGPQGPVGMNGSSVYITNINESAADSGNNIVTFSDGTRLTIKNGSKGSTGSAGPKGDTGSQGPKGDTGPRGPAGTDANVTKANITNALGYTPADQEDVTELNEKIVQQQAILDGKQPIGNYLTEIPSEYVTEEELDAELEDFKKQAIQQTPLFANSVEDMTDKSKVYVLKGTNEIWAYMLTEKEVTTGGYHNRLETATETYNGTTVYGGGKGYLTGVRLSSSGSTSTGSATNMLATGFISAHDGSLLDGARIRTVGFNQTTAEMQCYVNTYNSSGTFIKSYTWTGNYIADFTLDSATYGTGIKYIRISSSAKSTLPSIVTVNEEIKEGGTTTETVEAWASTGFTFVPADYEDRIVELERTVKKSSNTQNTLGIIEVFAPSPQLPANDSQESDLNILADVITAEQIYGYIDALLNKYPRFITKEVMGKDASNTHDWCRYVCSRRAYDAWQKPNYPPMYAWVNGSTTIYSVSVSPRIGDTLYTTKYIGTAKGNVTAVSNANQTRTVGGVAYTRDKTKDVEPTLVYTETSYSPYFSSNYSNACKGVYDGSKTKISTISSMSNGTLTDASGNTYKRYPLGDRNSKFKEIPAIVIGANEHGTGGDPATPAMISARIAKDLCECKQMDNPFLNMLKNEYMVVFCPVVNPWGLNYNNKSYFNANGVNLDRNFDTIGWMTTEQEPAGWNTGAYGGSENETQYFMNTLVASKCKVAMCNHSYGHGLDSTTGEAVSGGICSYMMGRNKTKYAESLLKIAEVMACNYNLVFTDNGEAPPENWAKTRSYFESIGVDGVALEINSRDGFVTDPNNEAKGKQFTGRVMEAGYTQLLQVLYMLISKLDV